VASARRRRRTLTRVAIVWSAFAAGGGAPALAHGLPVLPMSPSAGGPGTTFVLTLPAAVVRTADSRADLYVDVTPPAGSSRSRCAPYRLPLARFSGTGEHRIARFLLRPALLRKRGAGWCRGLYRVVAYAETIVTDDEETGEGGTFDDDLGRATFRVRGRGM
jgi:hypothetical protein